MTDQAIKAAKEMRDEAVRLVNISEANRGPLLGEDTITELRTIANRISAIPIPWAPEPKFSPLVICSGTTTSIMLMLRDRGMYQTEDYVLKLAQESDAKDATIARLSSQVEAARKALEPFLKILRGHSYVPDHVSLDVPVSALDRNRAVLAKLSAEGGSER